MEKERKAIGALEKFHADVCKDWKKQENRILGHIVISPPLDVGEEGFAEDWAVIKIDDSKIDLTNFVGNVIDLGTTISVGNFTVWMDPHRANPPLFEYPGNRLLKFSGTISDEEMWRPQRPPATTTTLWSSSAATPQHCPFIHQVSFNGQPGQTSKGVAILPRDYKANAFSNPGDSGSAVIDGKGRLAGLLTGGAGANEEFDCSYVTSIDFILKRMLEYGIEANLHPSLG